jgi:hypothetical protein
VIIVMDKAFELVIKTELKREKRPGRVDGH